MKQALSEERPEYQKVILLYEITPSHISKLVKKTIQGV